MRQTVWLWALAASCCVVLPDRARSQEESTHQTLPAACYGNSETREKQDALLAELSWFHLRPLCAEENIVAGNEYFVRAITSALSSRRIVEIHGIGAKLHIKVHDGIWYQPPYKRDFTSWLSASRFRRMLASSGLDRMWTAADPSCLEPGVAINDGGLTLWEYQGSDGYRIANGARHEMCEPTTELDTVEREVMQLVVDVSYRGQPGEAWSGEPSP